MPRRKRTSIANLPLDQLRQLVAKREQVLHQLQNREQSLEKELADVRNQISAIAGRGGPSRRPGRPAKAVATAGPKRRGRRGRGEGGLTVAGALAQIVRQHGKPMRVGEMAAAFAKSGHPTKSKNLAKLIAITLKSSRHFKRVARGLYTAK